MGAVPDFSKMLLQRKGILIGIFLFSAIIITLPSRGESNDFQNQEQFSTQAGKPIMFHSIKKIFQAMVG